MTSIVIQVSVHDGRFHGLDANGRAEWPPSPARLFQALVAAASRGVSLANDDQNALRWLENLSPPAIAVPVSHPGQPFSHFMPNNDLDAKGGDLRRIGEVRSATKWYRPSLFDSEAPFLYVWSFDGTDSPAQRIRTIAKRVYQFGRGIDMAWATCEIVDEHEAEDRLTTYPGAVYRPANHGRDGRLPCPAPGSLDSLIVRYASARQRFKSRWVSTPTKREPHKKKPAGQAFAQPPKPHFRDVAYGAPPLRLLYELHDGSPKAGFVVWPSQNACALVKLIRDDCAGRLEQTLKADFPHQAATVKRVFGLCRDTTELDKATRLRLIPLPSIGHIHADHGIRRILVEIPPNCPLLVRDIDWAFAGFCKFEPETGEVAWMLTRSDEQVMLGHYGIVGTNPASFLDWYTVTPVVLPVERAHGRSSGSQRHQIEAQAAAAMRQALRHIGLRQQPASIRVQREPFDTKGTMAQDFASGTRFDARRLWHVTLSFANPVTGPLVAGNGRYLGLGLFAPGSQTSAVIGFAVDGGLYPDTDPIAVARALRRAVMARVQNAMGKRTRLPTFFTGHEADGSVARRGKRSHLAYLCDVSRNRLLVLAPYALDRRAPEKHESENFALLESAMRDLYLLRAGAAGVLQLSPLRITPEADPLFQPSRRWKTQTSYQPTQHGKHKDLEQGIRDDVLAELTRRSLPLPAEVRVNSVAVGPRGGMNAAVALGFANAVSGPIILGRTSNFGGGIFAGAS